MLSNSNSFKKAFDIVFARTSYTVESSQVVHYNIIDSWNSISCGSFYVLQNAIVNASLVFALEISETKNKT